MMVSSVYNLFFVGNEAVICLTLKIAKSIYFFYLQYFFPANGYMNNIFMDNLNRFKYLTPHLKHNNAQNLLEEHF